MNWIRKIETFIKPIYLVGLFIVLLMIGFCREAEAQVTIEVGATFLSGEYADGQALVLTEQFEKYSIGIGYITEQEVTDRGDNFHELQENIFVTGMRHVDLTRKFEFGLGVAYFNDINRALGSNFAFSLLIRYQFTNHFGAQIRHFSNAGSARPNMGQDAITLGWSF